MSELSKNQIRKLGNRIREAYGDGTGKVSQEDLKLLQEYRLTFRNAIASVFDIVYKDCQSINKKSIVTYRIKRIESIIGKLKRMPDTELDRLIDQFFRNNYGNRKLVPDINRVKGIPQI